MSPLGPEITRPPSRGPRRRSPADEPPGPGWRRSPSGYWLPPHVGEVAEASAYNLTVVPRPQRPVVPSFDPASLPHLGWWDLSVAGSRWQDTGATSPATTAGQTLARIDDARGGSNPYLVQATSGLRPALTLTAGASGDKAGAVFSSKWITSSVNISSVNTVVVLVARVDSGGAWGRGSASGEYLYRPSGNTLLVGYSTASRGGTAYAINNAGLWASAGAYAIYTAVITPAAATTGEILRNGASYGTTNTAPGTTPLSATITIGATNSMGGDPGSITLMECGIGTYSSTQLAEWTTFLTTKWGIV